MKFTHIFLSLTFLLLFSSFSFANGDDSDEDERSLMVRSLNGFAAERTCAVNYVVGAIAIVSNASNSTNSNMTSYSATLQSDLSMLFASASNGSKEGFKQNAEKLKDDLHGAVVAIKESRAMVPSDLENATKMQLVDLRQTRGTCMLQAKLQDGGARARVMQVHINRYSKLVIRLSSRFEGLGVAGMNQVLADAKTQVLDPYKALVQNATTHKVVIEANRLYCLYDNCKNGSNFHLAAKFELAKLTALLNYAKLNYNVSANLTAQMQGNLDAASAAITRAGASHYGREQSEAIWGSLRKAAIDFKRIVLENQRGGSIRREARENRIEERAERRGQRNASRGNGSNDSDGS